MLGGLEGFGVYGLRILLRCFWGFRGVWGLGFKGFEGLGFRGFGV